MIDKRSKIVPVAPRGSEAFVRQGMLQKRRQEENLVICALADPKGVYERFGWLGVGDFADEGARLFWEKYLNYQGDAQRAMSEMGLSPELTRWMAQCPDTTRPDLYVAEMQRLGKAVQAMTATLAALAKLTLENTDTFITELAHIVESGEATGRPGRARASSDIGVAFMEQLDRGWAGFSSGFPLVDLQLGHLIPGDLTTLAARTSVGKTAFAWQIALQVAMSKHTCLYISNEQCAEQLWARRAAGNSGVDWRQVVAGMASPQQLESVRQATSELMDVLQDRVWVDDQSETLEEIHQSVASLRPDLIILDHLDEIAKPDNVESKVQWLADTVGYMRRLGKHYHAHVIVVHQLNRQLEGRADHRPTLADLRWSGDIEQKSDAVILLHRPDLYEEAGKDKSKVDEVLVEAWIAKNRIGPRDSLVNLYYGLSRQWFEESPKDQRPRGPIPQRPEDYPALRDYPAERDYPALRDYQDFVA